MQKRRLGNTDIEVSILGLGTVKFGRNTGVKYPTPFQLPTDKQAQQLLMIAKEQGINFLDTAPAYGQSEERLGKLLADTRHEWVICSKAGEEFQHDNSYFDFTPKALTASVERSLKRLKTDYLDILLIHSDGQDEALINEQQVFQTLAELKQAGKIRAFGMSSKTPAGGLLTVEKADVVMLAYHPDYPAEREVITRAQTLNKGVLIKKAFASGHFSSQATNKQPVANALNFILQEKGVTSIIVGTINPTHLQENCQCVQNVLMQK